MRYQAVLLQRLRGYYLKFRNDSIVYDLPVDAPTPVVHNVGAHILVGSAECLRIPVLVIYVDHRYAHLLVDTLTYHPNVRVLCALLVALHNTILARLLHCNIVCPFDAIGYGRRRD